MTDFDFETYISETKIAARKLKAIADAFAHEWVDQVNDATIVLLEDDPEPYQLLYTAVEDALCEVCSRIDTLEKEAAALLSEKTEIA